MEIANIRQMVAKHKPKVKTLRSLSEVELEGPYSIRLGANKFPLDHSAVKGLCKELDMPASFYTRLHSKNEDAWSRLTTALKASTRPHPLNLLAYNGKIIVITSDLVALTKHDEIIDAAEIVLKADKNMKLSTVEFTGINLNIHLLNEKKIDTGKWLDEKDLFRFGSVIKNNLVDGCLAQACFERMICTNLSYRPIIGVDKSSVRKVDEIPSLLLQLAYTDIEQMINAALFRMKSNNASVAEVLKVSDMLPSDDPILAKNLQAELRLNELAHSYGMTSEQIKKKNITWLATARTPFIMYDLYNWVTYLARHEPRLSQYERDRIRLDSGELLFSVPSLTSIAPTIELPKKPWLISPN